MNCSRLVVAVACALALVGCSTDPASTASDGSNEVDNETSTTASGIDASDNTDASAENAADYQRLEGEDLLFGFHGYTIDETHPASSLVPSMSYCAPNHGGTGIFRATGWLVDSGGAVILDEVGWRGHAYITLPIDDEAAAQEYPTVQLELNDRGIVLNTSGTDPADIEGTFTIDGETATGDFMVPDANGGPAQRIEFRITCPAED